MPESIQFNLSDDLKQKIMEISASNYSTPEPNPGKVSLKFLSVHYDALLEFKNNIKIEEYKLAIMESFHNAIRDEEELNNALLQKEEERIKNESRNTWCGKLIYNVSYYGGMVMDFGSSFVSVKLALQMIPGILNPIVFSISAFFGLTSMYFFHAFEARMLRDALGIASTVKDTQILLDLDDKQIDLGKDINHCVLNKNLSAGDFVACSELAKKFNTDIDGKKVSLIKLGTEQPYQKYKRWFVKSVGYILDGVGGAWVASSLLALPVIGLLGTPIGWGIIAAAVVCSIALCYAMRANGMEDHLNPKFMYNQLANKLKLFKLPSIEKKFNNRHKQLLELEEVLETKKRNQLLENENKELKLLTIKKEIVQQDTSTHLTPENSMSMSAQTTPTPTPSESNSEPASRTLASVSKTGMFKSERSSSYSDLSVIQNRPDLLRRHSFSGRFQL